MCWRRVCRQNTVDMIPFIFILQFFIIINLLMLEILNRKVNSAWVDQTYFRCSKILNGILGDRKPSHHTPEHSQEDNQSSSSSNHGELQPRLLITPGHHYSYLIFNNSFYEMNIDIILNYFLNRKKYKEIFFTGKRQAQKYFLTFAYKVRNYF